LHLDGFLIIDDQEEGKMGSSIIVIILVAILFVVLGVSVFFLWNRIFKKNLRFATDYGPFQTWVLIIQTFVLTATLINMGVQTKNIERSVKTNTVQLMFTNHRELLSMVIERPMLYHLMTGKNLPRHPEATVYLSMLLNHGFNIFTLREHCYIDDDWWVAIVQDMQDVYRRRVMREWWDNVKQFYPTRYQNFINRQILGEEKEGHQCGD
jgi:hypothetical protein